MVTRCIALVFFPLAVVLGVVGYNAHLGSTADTKPVCYFVASDQVVSGERSVRILMDPAEFSVGMLRPLMEDIFSQYPEPHSLMVGIDTDRSHWALADFDPPDYSYPIAYFYRKGPNELIRYRLSGPKLKTIVVKGEDPLSQYDSSLKSDSHPTIENSDREITPGPKTDTKPFCYFIDLNRVTDSRREIRILIGEEEFNEASLRVLLRHLFDKYPEPRSLTVLVGPGLDVLDDLIGAPMIGERPIVARPYAFLYRMKTAETIHYKLPGSDLKTVEVNVPEDR